VCVCVRPIMYILDTTTYILTTDLITKSGFRTITPTFVIILGQNASIYP
jgi:hypothetical protein